MRRIVTAGLAIALTTAYAFGGALTTDNLTVNKDATFYGNVNVQDASTGAVPTNGLVLYYRFSTNATDDSGNGHDATVCGATWVTNGITGGGYNFDGFDDYLLPPDISPLIGTGSFTIAFWAKAPWSQSTGVYRLFDNQAQSGGQCIAVYCGRNDGQAEFTFETSSDDAQFHASDLVDDQWYQFVVTYDASTGNKILYRNGVSVATGNQMGLDWSGTRSALGSLYYQGVTYQHLNGYMDEVMLFNRLLSASEVRGLYCHDAHLAPGSASFETGVNYLKPLGDLSMGVYTNNP